MSELSEEEIISPSDEVRIVNAFKYWYETNTEKGVSSIPDYICKDLLDLYNKEKEENRKLRQCHLRYEEMTGIDLLLEK